MFSNHDTTMIPKQEVYHIRLNPLVERELTSDKEGVYLEKCSQGEWLVYIMTEIMEHIPLERFITMQDDKLNGHVGRLMALHLVAGMLNDFTPEQMKIFDECLIRR